LSNEQKDKMKGELHANPELAHKKKEPRMVTAFKKANR